MKRQDCGDQRFALQGNKSATPNNGRHLDAALKDRTNQAYSNADAFPWKHPRDKSLGKPHSLAVSHKQEATGNETDENAPRDGNALAAENCGSATRHMPDETSCIPQDVSSTDAPASRTAAAVTGSSGCTQHDAGVESESKADMSATGVIKAERLGDSIQDSTVGSDTDIHLNASMQDPLCSGIAANAQSTLGAVSTVSPGRRIFAAQVTITRPTTPASPVVAAT